MGSPHILGVRVVHGRDLTLVLLLLSIFSLEDLFRVLLFRLEVQSEQSSSRSRCASRGTRRRSRPGSPGNPLLAVFSHLTAHPELLYIHAPTVDHNRRLRRGVHSLSLS